MAYYLDLFSPETYEAFLKTSQDISGFRKRQEGKAGKIAPGDKLVCYMTKVSRWIGVLEVCSEYFINSEPRFYETNDPFIVRFKVKPSVWLSKEKSIPIHEDIIWNNLSFTKNCEKNSKGWTGIFRCSLNRLSDSDGKFIEETLLSQLKTPKTYELNEEQYRKYVTRRVRRLDKTVSVTVPVEEIIEDYPRDKEEIRESYKMQALLASLGEKLGFNIWLPKRDRSAILSDWFPHEGSLLDILPLNYDETTLKTIEQIDVLWLKKRSIVRAFEIEHTTAIYSGILRMADLLALQPNMDIKLHIVAPNERREKVFQEIQRPVFSLLDRAPLAETCTFISYDSLKELSKVKHITHMVDSVIEDYEEEVE